MDWILMERLLEIGIVSLRPIPGQGKEVDLVDPNLWPVLRYGQVVKKRDERHRVVEVFKRSVYGDIPLETISTVYIERHNLTLRHENRRLTRKTVAFSKKDEGLKDQMTVYQSYFNFVRPHRGLKVNISDNENRLRKWLYRTPAVAASLTDHIWSFKELMTKKIYINH
jgi:hypothetical protein